MTGAAMKLIALSPIKCNGKRYAPGDQLEVDAEIAKALIASGAAEAGSKKEKAPPPPPPPPPAGNA